MTELPKAYEPKAVEPKWLDLWDKGGYFRAEVDHSRTPYCITIPPPNVTGELHLGHGLQHAIHDTLIRWKRMSGFNTLCVPGTDHASISTTIKVRDSLIQAGIDPSAIGREEFLKHAWAWKEKYGGTIIRQLKALGCSYDWSRERFTMDEGYYRAVQESFVRLHREGLIYRGARVVNWCPTDRTTVSDLEVIHKDIAGSLWYIRYPLSDGSGSVTVATTRPETMLGDTADTPLIIASYPEPRPAWHDESSENDMTAAFGVVEALRSIRADLNVPPGRTIPATIVPAEEASHLRGVESLISNLARADITFGTPNSRPPKAWPAHTASAEVFVPVEGLLDVSAALARTRKDLESTQKDLARTRGKLANEGFVQRAPAEIIEKERGIETELSGLSATLENRIALLESLA